MNTTTPDLERYAQAVRALGRYRARLARKLDGLRGDLAEAERAPHYRRAGEALLTYLKQVPPRAAGVSLPDPAEPARTIEIVLDPRLNAQGNAARYFKRAAKAERGLVAVPPRLAAAEAELHALDQLLERARPALEAAGGPTGGAAAGPALEQARDAPVEVASELEARSGASAEVEPAVEASGEAPAPLEPALARAVDAALAKLPPAVREAVHAPAVPRAPGAAGAPRGAPSRDAVARGEHRAPSSRLQPRRLKTAEGWDVLIGRSSEGNDYLTHHLARPEDYWFHVSGASGSHVVIRRGKGKNEPSRRTIEEVAAWAAFYSQARTAGKVPVLVTQKRYVRKPRKARPGLAHCERAKTVMARPAEPPRESLADAAEAADAGE
ncbi:MAG: DUF814 domain-containing protein [Candidatus Eisenbacteria bacterium]|nr:DUF814 domain-containing protein [Candidatus Eisenbacteria bacterium]